MKSPPIQYTDDKARELTEAFIAGKDSGTRGGGQEVAPKKPKRK
jgi:hypothetical protein